MKQNLKFHKTTEKIFVMLILTAVLLSALTIGASADCGPKDSVTISFPNISGEFYVTLLSTSQSYGPWSAEHATYELESIRESDPELHAAFLKMHGYSESGYYFLGNVQRCSSRESYRWGYYPPNCFKVLIYNAETESFYTSEQLSQYAFSSYYEAEIDEGGGLTCRQSYDYGREALLFLGRVALTLAIELLIALPFGYLKAGRRGVIIYTNLTTQLLLNLALNAINFRSGWLTMMIAYLLLEIGVFVIEGAVYTAVTIKRPEFDDRRGRAARAWLYALAANFASFAAGIAIFYIQKELGLL